MRAGRAPAISAGNACPRAARSDSVPASDGEEYFAMALFFAAHRWGNGAGIYDYESEANAILDTMLHKEEMNGGVVAGVTNMFDRAQHQIVFVPVGNMGRLHRPFLSSPRLLRIVGALGARLERAARRRTAPSGGRRRRAAGCCSPRRPIRRPASRPIMRSLTGGRARSAAMAISASTPSGPR